MFEIILLVGIILLIIIIPIYYISMKGQRQALEEQLRQESNKINTLFKNLENITKERDDYLKRSRELEDSIEKGYGIKIRQEITNVIIDFTKIEIVIMLAGVTKLLSATSNPEDAKIYIELIEKVNGFIEHMREEGEGPFSREGQ